MNDLEIMIRAQQYIDSLANGTDPLTGQALPETDIVNNVRISRCLSYVSEVLQKVIDNGGEIKKPRTKRADLSEFSLTPEQAAALVPSDDDLFVSKVANIINAQIDENTMKKLKTTTITSWLLDKGLLTEIIINGKAHKNPTSAGESIGISLTGYRTQTGSLVKICAYSPEAQQFIFDNIDVIAEYQSGSGKDDAE